MAWTCYQIAIAFVMVITGSINTLSTKWADTEKSIGSDGMKKVFEHPFLQAVGMFLGEFTCLIAFNALRLYRKKTNKPMEIGNQQFNPLIFLPAALCDMCGTSIMYVGLNMTFASSFQMLRGSVIIFTALLSVAFLRRHIFKFMWLGMFIIVAGLVFVGLSDVLFGNNNLSDINGIISGDLLIIMAQVIVAVQMVYEEKVISRHDVPPLQAVGWEGFFGFIVLGLFLIPMYFIHVPYPFCSSRVGLCRLEDPVDAFTQMKNNWRIILATIGNIVSIAFFNFAGISITREISATTRMVLDSVRTLVIWAFSLAVMWQPFTAGGFLMQFAGFVLLILGMCIYNDIICAPFLCRKGFLGPREDEMISRSYPVIQGDSEERTPILTATPSYGPPGATNPASI